MKPYVVRVIFGQGAERLIGFNTEESALEAVAKMAYWVAHQNDPPGFTADGMFQPKPSPVMTLNASDVLSERGVGDTVRGFIRMDCIVMAQVEPIQEQQNQKVEE